MSETVRSEVHWKPQDRLLQLRGMTLEGLALDVDLVTEPNVNVMQGLPVWNKLCDLVIFSYQNSSSTYMWGTTVCFNNFVFLDVL